MLEKQLGSRSFGTIIGHLVCCRIIFLIFSGGLGLSSVVGRVTPALLRGWAFIVLTLIFRFQHDDHFVLLDVVAHVMTCPQVPC